MKKLDGSELNILERANINIGLVNRLQSLFTDAALDIELTEDDIKFALLNYLSTSTGKDWHLSSSVTLHGDIEISQQIQMAENNLYKNGSRVVHIGINNKNNAFIDEKELDGKDKLIHRNKQIEKETLRKLLMGGTLAHEEITLEERANKIARSIKTAFLILEDN